MRWRPGRGLIAAVVLLLVALVATRSAVGFYTELLWHAELGTAQVLWKRIAISVLIQGVAGSLAAVIVLLNLWVVARQVGTVHVRRRYGNLEIAERVPPRFILAGIVVTAAFAGWWLANLQFGGGGALPIFAWMNHVAWGVTEPIFGHDVAFYVYTLPLLGRFADFFLLIVIWTVLLVAAGYVLVGAIRLRGNAVELDDGARIHAAALVATFVVLIGVRFLLSRYNLLLDGTGVKGSLGYTDVHVRMPVLRGLAVVSFLAAAGLVFGAVRRTWTPAALAGGLLGIGLVGGAYLAPGLVQKFQVEPNEFAREVAFISLNLQFTPRGYGLDALDRRSYAFATLELPEWEELAPFVEELPLWDRSQLQVAFNQRQSLVGYYRFVDVDFDRYQGDGRQRQAALSVREFDPEGVPEVSRTWQNLRLNPRYTRGWGVVVAPAAETSVQGEPLLWLGGLEPLQRHPDAPPAIHLATPAVYFGETARGYVLHRESAGAPVGRNGAPPPPASPDAVPALVASRASAMAQPRDQRPGAEPGVSWSPTSAPRSESPTGVELGSFLRRAAFAWRFGDPNLLLSAEITPETLVLFRRSPGERLRAVAPFMLWDSDSYPVVIGGRLLWVVEGYSASSSFPLARPYRLDGVGAVRYLRPSVKGIVDASSGEVAIYAGPEAEPLLETYRRVFPELVRDFESMPPELRRHLRYPQLYLHAQAEILQEYHLRSPEAFYASQDIWQMPDDQGRQGFSRRGRAEYFTMALPGSTRPEFLLSATFIARERQNMTAVLLGRSDPPHYGELVLLELPRDQLIAGPGQVHALVEQDPVISAQLALWRQHGSDVEMGKMRIVPIGTGFLYVQPVFLSAADAEQRIPELEQVVVSDGRRTAMAGTLRDAVRALRARISADGPDAFPPPAARDGFPAPPGVEADEEWSRRALELLLEAEARLREGDWTGFGEGWTELRRILEQRVRERGSR